ncbi:ATP-dependent nuclease [Chryseobacterium terrae]|uniref:TOPRIM nucleotidyl transferase/hydrolase domain-containing protein n=1 Tax=Chryseobacterium terrae TaxID=3163299 RepID=A0ABW8Y6Z1_9FLAO
MKHIKRIKLKNFRRFKEFSVEFNETLNLLIGDNESGKSSILEAINIVLAGSRNKVETIGLDNLFNQEVITEFLAGGKKYEDLPILFAEIYFNEQHDFELFGRNNSEEIDCDGFRLECSPNDDLSREIKEILKQEDISFPYEFYQIKFNTFQGDAYSGFKKYFKHILIDNSQISSEYAVKEYVRDMYNNLATSLERNNHHYNYRQHKLNYKTNVLADVNTKTGEYEFIVRNNTKSNLSTDLALSHNNINIENKGKGIQCFIKTKFALNKSGNLDIVLLEEPENHLSHINMKKMVKEIEIASQKQIFIATHSNMLSTRLDLRKSILLNSNSEHPILLDNVKDSTAKFFMKAPDNNLLDFILSKKALLVEGDAEYMLLESFFKKHTGISAESADVHIISVDGTSFKRYLDISQKLGIKTAVIRDNDGDLAKNCIENYSDYTESFIKIFYDNDNGNTTFEKCIYYLNQKACESLFSKNRKKLSVLDYMLKNKAEASFQLLDKKKDELEIPQYIKDAIEWIRK